MKLLQRRIGKEQVIAIFVRNQHVERGLGLSMEM